MSILKKLFDGEIYPLEQINPHTPKYNELIDRTGEMAQHFREKFSQEDYERIELCQDLYREISYIEEYESFRYGIRLGAKLALEILDAAGE